MNRTRTLFVPLIAVVCVVAAPAGGRAAAGTPFVFAQSEGFRPPSSFAAPKAKTNRTTELIVRAGILAALSLLIAALSYYGLFPLLLRQGSLPLNAFAIATITATTSFFLLLLGLFWDDLQPPIKIGSGGWTDHLVRVFIIATMLGLDLTAWGFRRSRAREIRAAR